MRFALASLLAFPLLAHADRAGPPDPKWVMSLDAGNGATCVVRGNGDIQCWGQIQRGTTTDVATPTKITAITGVRSMKIEGAQICGVRATGTIGCWPTGAIRNQIANAKAAPIVVTDVGVKDANDFALGSGSGCTNDTNGHVQCWGRNDLGQGATGDTKDLLTPRVVPKLTDIVAMTSNAYSYCALSAGSVATCWGYNAKGELGDGTTTTRLAPTSLAKVKNVDGIALGSAHGCAIVNETIACWGDNSLGQLGDGTTKSHLTPTALPKFAQPMVVEAGGGGTCMIDMSSQLWCWGDSAPDATTRTKPVRPFTDRVVRVSIGADHTCALLEDVTTVRCWGNNAHGQLGDGQIRTGRFAPTKVPL